MFKIRWYSTAGQRCDPMLGFVQQFLPALITSWMLPKRVVGIAGSPVVNSDYHTATTKLLSFV